MVELIRGVVTRYHLHLLLLGVSGFAAAYARNTLGPVQESMRVSLGWTDHYIALLQGTAPALPMVLAAVPLGMLIDRFSRTRLILIFAVLNLLGTIASASTNFALLFAARALIGVTAPGIVIVAFSLMADLVPAGQRGRASMAIMIGQVCGSSLVFAFGGWLLVALEADRDSWRMAMLWMAVPLVVVFVALTALRDPPRTKIEIQSRCPFSIRGTCLELWEYRRTLAPLLIGAAILGVADCAAYIWAAPTLTRRFGLAPDHIGAIVALVLLVSGLAGPIIGGSLADLCHKRGGPRRTLAVLAGLTLLSTPAGFFALAPNIESTSVLLCIFLAIGGAISVALTTLTTIVMPQHLRGLSISVLISTMLLIGVGVGPILVSALSASLGGTDMIATALVWICAGTSLLVSSAFLIGRRYYSRETLIELPA